MLELRYSDEYLNECGDRFIALDLRNRLGITFLEYLQRPEKYQYEAVVNGELKSKAEVDAIIEQAERPVDHLPRRNGAFIEPLHHRAHPRKANRGFFKKPEVQS